MGWIHVKKIEWFLTNLHSQHISFQYKKFSEQDIRFSNSKHVLLSFFYAAKISDSKYCGLQIIVDIVSFGRLK